MFFRIPLLLFVLFISLSLAAQPRHALVIGNGDYALAPLYQTPVNDARAMETALRKAGFSVDAMYNLNANGINDALSAFGQKVRNSGGVALVYFSGHGLQYKNRNYLVPTGVTLRLAQDIKGFCVPVDRVVGYLQGTGLNIVILDACRSYPIPEEKGLLSGLVSETFDEAPAELLVAYATAPNTTATAGGENGMSLYTSQLVKYLNQNCLKIEDVFKRARADVYAKSARQQRPEETGSLTSDFYFMGPCDASPPPPEPVKTTEESPTNDPARPGIDTDVDGIPDATDPCPQEYGVPDGCPDYDQDGVPNKSDKCPRLAGQKYWEGCPDTDADGLPDHEDQCPFEKGLKTHNGCLPPDSDRDGTPDESDACPDQFGAAALGGCPDRDNDGVADKSDQCPDQSGEKRYQGCPDTDADGLPDHEDECPNLKGAIADKGCPDTDVDGLPDHKDECPNLKGAIADNGCPPDPFAEDMVWMVGGKFNMGSNESDEKPIHEVELDGFYIARYEVTQAQWRAVMGADPPELTFKNCDQCPVEGVSWNDVEEFIQRLNAQTGKIYRLPTEAEWEYAARGGVKSIGYTYAGGNNLGKVGWYGDNSKRKTHPIGQKSPNEKGLYDMSGNVWEWCADWYGSDEYSRPEVKNPAGSATGSYRVVRGGSWYGYSRDCRVANRDCLTPDFRFFNIGFRLARTR